ncbi:uncharacterized protein PHACADRAFT_261350 [Phanerochaete carnosa HHB-10118-sp]|uniref:Uncharacterized protein n=1 Tax=Phanerochaete carnosa (strain HHB-10118-sp) TaxID=650164 RepID=K5W0X1_PHACS|nr:uncharacterized protein PHACADRAFT_261350 [Phanerochaete carnosa HHB-10118-sp]EKM52745.1 hypothetical protein PHACADRAFT_261350 [Phanerochaete carnosa HHB-10118-sp]
MGNQDDHHDAHVTNLRVLLGSILSPKRASYTRSSTSTSGTASPAFPSHPGSPELPASRPQTHPHAHATGASSTSRGAVSTPPTLSRADSSASISDHVSMPRHYAMAPPPATSSDVEGTAHRPSRADLLGTLQSKNTAWDALIHGSFV